MTGGVDMIAVWPRLVASNDATEVIWLLIIVGSIVAQIVKTVRRNAAGRVTEGDTDTGVDPQPVISPENELRAFLENLNRRAAPRPVPQPPPVPKPPSFTGARTQPAKHAPGPPRHGPRPPVRTARPAVQRRATAAGIRTGGAPVEVDGDAGRRVPEDVRKVRAAVRRMLTDPGDLKAAFLVREILGPPKGLMALRRPE